MRFFDRLFFYKHWIHVNYRIHCGSLLYIIRWTYCYCYVMANRDRELDRFFRMNVCTPLVFTFLRQGKKVLFCFPKYKFLNYFLWGVWLTEFTPSMKIVCTSKEKTLYIFSLVRNITFFYYHAVFVSVLWRATEKSYQKTLRQNVEIDLHRQQKHPNRTLSIESKSYQAYRRLTYSHKVCTRLELFWHCFAWLEGY